MSAAPHAPLIALAAGGTGGHMFPAEALAEELVRRGARILLVTDERGLRYADSFPREDTVIISAASPNVGGPVAKMLAAVSMAGALIVSMSQFRRRGVDAAVGFGGYPSLPAMKAAALMKIPYGLHEQNGVLGRSNRMLAGEAAFTAHAFPDLARLPAKAGNAVEVGNPVRESVMALAGAPYEPPAPDGEIRLLVFGGSQGASIFAKVAPRAIAALPDALRGRLRIVQQAREGEIDAVRAAYVAAGVEAEIAPFFGDLPSRIANAHLVVARSGASTVTEVATIGRPAVFIPLAIAMDDHQTGNARTLADPGAAEIIAEQDFEPAALAQTLTRLFEDPRRLAEMAAAARGRVKPGAAAALADLTLRLCARPEGSKAAA